MALSLTHAEALTIMAKGTLYFPAAKHYPMLATPSVHCDMCLRGNINSCIGFEDRDLCMWCAERITSGVLGVQQMPCPVPPHIPKVGACTQTRMYEDSARRRRETPTTLMKQDSAMYQDPSHPLYTLYNWWGGTIERRNPVAIQTEHLVANKTQDSVCNVGERPMTTTDIPPDPHGMIGIMRLPTTRKLE